MRIAYIAAGAGGMYCGSCLHDNTLASALIRRGHEVALIPTYTPLRTDETSVSMERVFFGGLNIYLQQKLPAWRHMPEFVKRRLDNPGLIRWIAARGTRTDARNLGALTLSTIQGEHGVLRSEFEKLVTWLRDSYKPELVTLTNSMFVGLAEPLKRELGVPVLCAMQGEDLFLNALVDPWRTRVLDQLRETAKNVDRFIATSDYYSEYMTAFLSVPPAKISTVRLGISLDGHDSGERSQSVPTIGYLARISPEKGLHLLIDAFTELASAPAGKAARLKIAGYLGPGDKSYFQDCMARIDRAGLGDRVEYAGELSREQKLAFLQSIDVLSVPTTYAEPKGLFVLEALANGVPAVQPEHGAFPEMRELTGGLLLFEPGSSEALRDALALLVADTEQRKQLGTAGADAVRARFTDAVMASATEALFEELLGRVPLPGAREAAGAADGARADISGRSTSTSRIKSA